MGPLDPVVIRNLDEKTKRALNGHGGGFWAPSAPIVIGGAGLEIQGGCYLLGGSSVEATNSSPIVFGSNTADDYFELAPGHEARSQAKLLQVGDAHTPKPSDLQISTLYACVQARAKGARFFTPIRVVDGGTIAAVAFHFRVTESHAAVPQELPQFRVVRVDADGTVEPLRAPDATTDEHGRVYFGPTPASGAAWYAAGAGQSFSYACNQNNLVDVARFAYFAEITEESGASAWVSTGTVFTATITTCTEIALLTGRH